MGSPDPPEQSVGHRPPEQRTRPVRIRFLFFDRYDWLGPAIIVLSSWYFAAQVLVAWVFRPQYSFVSNAISDLGNTACRTTHAAGSAVPASASTELRRAWSAVASPSVSVPTTPGPS